ncbi:MAG: hypothetical protein KC441_11170, partial [Anaerolineales bacterium]|nr:hypothetical protein [Anaerolineales bacterium]
MTAKTPHYVTFINPNHELCECRESLSRHTIQSEMSDDFPELFDLSPEKALAYLFDRLPVGTA